MRPVEFQDDQSSRSGRRLLSVAAVVALLAVFAGGARTRASVVGGPNWAMIGNDPANSRNQRFEHSIGPENASKLALKWVATTAGDVSATPAVVDGAVYFGDFGGMLVVGDLMHPYMLGIDTQTGELRWITQVHPDPKGIMTGSPVLAGDTIYTGVSASGASGPSATFRGSIVALNAQTGQILWQSYSLPDNGGLPGGYAGSTMFSPPAVNISAGLVYGTFGQPYTEPASVTACHAAHGGFT